MWREYEIDNFSYSFGKELKKDSLKSIIANNNLSTSMLDYFMAAKYNIYTICIKIREPKARAQTNWLDTDTYASYIGFFDHPLYIRILNDYFENSQGKERYECFFQLGCVDYNGQPERTIFALKKEITIITIKFRTNKTTFFL